MPDTQPQDTSSPSPDIGSIVGSDQSSISDLVASQRARTAEDFAITRKADVQLDRDQARVERAYTAEGVGHDELKPWDADKEHKKFEENPIEGFGSVGGLFAMVASAFTKAPMENAINGMAGAINSIKAGDEAAYQRAHESWKDNTKLAIDRWKMQHDLYQDALGLMDHDQAAATAKLRNSATRFGDSQTLMLAEHGMVKELFELQTARANAAEQMQKSLDTITDSSFQRAAIKAIVADPPNTGDEAHDKMILATKVHQALSGGKETGTPLQTAMGTYWTQHSPKEPGFVDGLVDIYQQFSPKGPNTEMYQAAKQSWRDSHDGQEPPPEEDAKMLQQAGLTGVHGTTGGMITESKLAGQEISRRAQKDIDAGMDPSEAFDKAMKGVKAAQQEGRGSLTRIDSAEVNRRKEELRKEHPDWSEDKIFDVARTGVAAARTGGLLDDKARKVIAGQVKAGDNSGMVGLNPANRIAVRQEVADSMVEAAKTTSRADIKKQHPDWDDEMVDNAATISTDQLGKTLALSSADYQGTRTALRSLSLRSVAIKQAAVEAQKFMKIAQDASDKVPRTKIVKFNEFVQMVEHGTSDPDLKEFAVANNALVQQYSRAIMPTGVPTDDIRRHAYSLLGTVDGPEAYKRVLNIMNKEMEAAIASPDAVRAMVMGSAKDISTTMETPKSFEGQTIRYDKEGNRIKDGG